MDEEQLRQFLCNNLSVEVDVDRWMNTVTVRLFVCNRNVSEFTDSLPEYTRPND